jgi:hypothetical protein
MKLRVPKLPEWATAVMLALLPFVITAVVLAFRDLFSTNTVILGFVFFTAAASLIWAFPDTVRKWTSYLAFLGGMITYFIAPPSINVEKFYELTVQVVPVLFLTLGLEQRTFRYEPSGEADLKDLRFIIFVGFPAITLAIAGAESLRTIATGNPQRGTFDLVAGALVAAAISLTLTAIVGPYHPEQSGVTESPQ